MHDNVLKADLTQIAVRPNHDCADIHVQRLVAFLAFDRFAIHVCTHIITTSDMWVFVSVCLSVCAWRCVRVWMSGASIYIDFLVVVVNDLRWSSGRHYATIPKYSLTVPDSRMTSAGHIRLRRCHTRRYIVSDGGFRGVCTALISWSEHQR